MFDSNLNTGSDVHQDAAAVPTRPALKLAPSSSRTPRVDSRSLLGAGRDLIIDHAGQQYRLRLTRNDKLILTK